MATITKEIQEAIDNYGDNIKTLEDFQTAVKTRPGMYIGPIGSEGLLNMIREIFQNSVDQMMLASSPCNHFSLSYNEQTLEVTCEDNGLGIPFNDIIRIMTEPHTSKNFNKVPFEYSSGLNGIGAKVVNALSTDFVVESYRYDGTAIRMEFKNGYPTSKKGQVIPNKKNSKGEYKQGTKISFVPNSEVMGDMSLEWKRVYKLIKYIMCQTNIGNYMQFDAVDYKGQKFTEKIVNQDGIVSVLIMKVKHPLIKPIIVYEDDGFHKLNCAFCFDSGGENGPDPIEDITAFSNFCPTSEGTHIDGVLDGICRWFTLYMNNIYLSNQKSKDKLKVTSADIKNGLTIMISAAHLDPEFTGQAKERLSNKDMEGFCKEVVMKGLDEWSKSNPQDLAKLSKFFKDIAELRQKSEKEKVKITAKYDSNPINSLPKKYKRPLSDKNVELIIVEGDSALGTAATARDPKFQGIMPIRGKIINAFTHPYAKVFENEEVQGITRIILGKSGYRRNFDISECKVSRVIFMADADIDGNHIAALLLRLFVMYFPQMIKAGMVYKAIPPLYSIKNGNKNRYFIENIDMVKYVQKAFNAEHTVCDMKGNPVSDKEMAKFFIRNADYSYYLESMTKTYAVDPELLELVLNSYMMNGKQFKLDKLKKEVESKYRFMTLDDKRHCIIGTIDDSNFIPLTNKFIKDCSSILRLIELNDQLLFKVDNKVATIHSIMNMYDAASPRNVQRYKGLGEMPRQDLAESTLDINTRTLIKYTMESAKEDIEIIREYESNPKKILDHVGDISREELLD